MDLIINIIFVCLMTFNVSASIIEWKKIKQDHKLKKQRLKEKNEQLEEKKQKLNIDLKHLKKENFNKNIYAKFTKEDADYVLKVTDKIKTNQDLAHFESALLKNIKIEFMRNFFINAPYITIKKFSLLEAPIKNDHRILGTYNGSTKEIKVYDKKESTLNHELLHAASSDFTYSAVGFSVEFEKLGMFGEGLNEGYTELINNRIINDLNNIFYDFLILIKAKLYEESFALMEELLKCKVRFKILTAEFNSENDSNEDNKILIRNLYESKFINRSYAMNNLLTLYYHLWNKVKTKDDNDDNIISTLKMYRTNVGKIK